MKPLILTILPIAVLLGAIFLARFSIGRSSEKLATEYRLLGICLWILPIAIAIGFILDLTMHGSFAVELNFLLIPAVLVIWKRRRLSRQMNESKLSNA